jgi:hypothetical protein
MIKKIALGSLFILSSFITVSSATATTGKAEKAAGKHASRVEVPSAPVPQGLSCGGRC